MSSPTEDGTRRERSERYDAIARLERETAAELEEIRAAINRLRRERQAKINEFRALTRPKSVPAPALQDRRPLPEPDAIDGVVNHTALGTAMGKVPNARFEDATDVIGLVRYVKSEEEIQFVRRSAEVAAVGLDELIKLARPGVDAGIFYSDVLAKMLSLCSEYFPLTLSIDALGTAKPKRYTNPPIGRRLEAGAPITSEINAIMGAQLTQVCQPGLLGKIPEPWKPVIALQREVYEAGLQMIKPGVTFGALEDFVKGFGAKRGMQTMLQMHGCGYGGDGPLFTHRERSERSRDLVIEKNNAFVWKPMARSADGKQFACGGPIIVTENGCESFVQALTRFGGARLRVVHGRPLATRMFVMPVENRHPGAVGFPE